MENVVRDAHRLLVEYCDKRVDLAGRVEDPFPGGVGGFVRDSCPVEVAVPRPESPPVDLVAELSRSD